MAGQNSKAGTVESHYCQHEARRHTRGSAYGHGFQWERHGVKEEVEASSPRALVETSKHRRRRYAWRAMMTRRLGHGLRRGRRALGFRENSMGLTDTYGAKELVAHVIEETGAARTRSTWRWW